MAPYATAQAPMPSTPGTPPMVGKSMNGGAAHVTAPKDIIDTATGPGMTRRLDRRRPDP